MYLTKKNGKAKRENKKRVGTKTYKTGIVYLIKVTLDNDNTIYKIGATGRQDIQPRLFEIASTLLLVHGYVPRMEVLLSSRTKDYFRAETMMHTIYSKYKYEVDKRISGSSEWFRGLDYDTLVPRYKEIMNKCQIKEKPVEKKDVSVYEVEYEIIEDDNIGML